VPTIIHWGPDLGDLSAEDLQALAVAQSPAVGPSSIDVPLRVSLLPTSHSGYSGRPGISGHSADATAPRFPGVGPFALSSIEQQGNRVRVTLTSQPGEDPQLSLVIDLELTTDAILTQRLTLTNTGTSPFALASLDATLPLPERAAELLDFSGRWPQERAPQRRAMADGTWTRDSRHGRTGHDAAFLMVAGTPGFGFRSGEVWATHIAFSGDQRLWAESHATGLASCGGGELLEPGEIRLESGASYRSPLIVSSYSSEGLDGLTAQLHRYVRAVRPTELTPRKVMLNTWEAVYFDHDEDRLIELADAAADVGVERFVLDDGWMLGRTDDRRALGDWIVDPEKWPRGLHPLIDHVVSRGMDFGLWVEPEMISADSQVARAHPDWILPTGEGSPLSWRFQQVIDLANPAVFEYILTQLSTLLTEYPIAYLKWDQNRDMLGGSAHAQTLATYALMDELRSRFPGLEIESCSSGGGRVDLGVLARTDRVWPSDTNDPLERQAIFRWTSTLIPPEYLGVHLGAATAHTTGRTSGLAFRLATALFGHAGIEWDVSRANAEERAAIATWIGVYKAHRDLLHSGVIVRADPIDPTRWVHGVVAADKASALFAVVALSGTRAAVPGPTLLPGLEPDQRYEVTVLDVGAAPKFMQDAPPAWWGTPIQLTGRMLASAGLALPLLEAEQALVLEVRAL
jgi:alpha-galactosidase